MNHKRGRARRRRAGCKLCKPWKLNGVATESLVGEKFSDHRRRKTAEEDETRAMESLFKEWSSAADEKAYREL